MRDWERIRQKLEPWLQKCRSLLVTLSDTRYLLRTRVRRAFHECGHLFFKTPQRLSLQTDSLAEIRVRRCRGEHVELGERFHRFLHSQHSLRSSSILGLCIFAGCVFLAAIGGLIYGTDPSQNDELIALASSVVTVAEVLGGVAGILFAVAVFGIQFHGEQFGQASYLVKYLGRREGVAPIAAVTLAVVASNVVISILASLWHPGVIVAMAVADLGLVPGVLWLSLWLLHRMLATVFGDFFEESLIPGLSWEFHRGLDEETYRASLQAEYNALLEKAAIEWSCVPWAFGLEPNDKIEFSLRKRGTIYDVNVTAIESLASLLRNRCADYEAVLALTPGDELQGQPGLLLKYNATSAPGLRGQKGRLDNSTRSAIRKTLESAFLAKPQKHEDVISTLAKLSEHLVALAERDTPGQFARVLDVQRQLIKLRLDRTEAKRPAFSFHSQRLPDYVSPNEYKELAEATVASGEKEKIEILLGFAGNMLQLAIELQAPRLAAMAGSVIEWTYISVGGNAELEQVVAQSLDTHFYLLMGYFNFYHNSQATADVVRSEMGVLLEVFKIVFRLIVCALSAGHTKDAEYFHDRLLGWEIYENSLERQIFEEQNLRPHLRELLDLHAVANLILASWAIHCVGSRDTPNQAAISLLNSARNMLPSREELLRVYEVCCSLRFEGTTLHEYFGLRTWSQPFRGPHRAGKSCFGFSHPDEWFFDGVVALLMAQSAHRRSGRLSFLQEPPTVNPENERNVETRAKRVIEDDWVREHVLGIGDGEKQNALTSVVRLFASRRRLYLLKRLRDVVESSLSEPRIAALRSETLAELPGKRGMLDALCQLGLSTSAAALSEPPIAQDEIHVRKDTVCEGADGPTGFGQEIARKIGHRESIEIAISAEKSAPAVASVDAFNDLCGAIDAARDRLTALGYQPSLLLIPHVRVFAITLESEPPWESTNSRTYGKYHLGRWQSLEVFRFPNDDPQSIVLLDASRFFTKTELPLEEALVLRVDDAWREEYLQSLTAAGNEDDPNKIPEAYNVQVNALAKLTLGGIVRDSAAGARIQLDLTKLGFATQPSDRLYHRPGCALLKPDEEITYGLATFLVGEEARRQPCDVCKSKEWAAGRETGSIDKED